jgi:hypothetical protein
MALPNFALGRLGAYEFCRVTDDNPMNMCFMQSSAPTASRDVRTRGTTRFPRSLDGRRPDGRRLHPAVGSRRHLGGSLVPDLAS